MKQTRDIGIVGASGLVGQELVSILIDRGIPAQSLALFARRRSTIVYRNAVFDVNPLDVEVLSRCGLVFLVATAELARDLVPLLLEAGAVTVDNSSAYRMDNSVPLVIPEVNPGAAAGLLLANPNCSTILLLLLVAPLHRVFGCRHVAVCTYQAVSGAGREAVERLRNETTQYLATPAAAYRNGTEGAMAFNVWSHESPIDIETGMNAEEAKIVAETRKILDPGLQVSATCIRVPVERAHGEAVTVEFETPLAEADVRRVIEQAPGVRVVDDRNRGHAPTARLATGGDEVLVGRIRPDHASLDSDGKATRFHFWLTGDQLRKGAALNAVQIAELVGLMQAQTD